MAEPRPARIACPLPRPARRARAPHIQHAARGTPPPATPRVASLRPARRASRVGPRRTRPFPCLTHCVGGREARACQFWAAACARGPSILPKLPVVSPPLHRAPSHTPRPRALFSRHRRCASAPSSSAASSRSFLAPLPARAFFTPLFAQLPGYARPVAALRAVLLAARRPKGSPRGPRQPFRRPIVCLERPVGASSIRPARGLGWTRRLVWAWVGSRRTVWWMGAGQRPVWWLGASRPVRGRGVAKRPRALRRPLPPAAGSS